MASSVAAVAPDAGPEPAPHPPTTHAARIRYLDGWRGLSILLVLVGHFVPGGEKVAGAGVQLFFALSGRLMADILFVERFPLAGFYKRRISRIYPALVAFVLATWMLVSVTDLSFKWPAVAAALTFTLNYGLVFGHGVPAIENLWSLCIEEHSYLLLGALAFLLRRRPAMNPVWPLLAVAGLSLLDGLVSVGLLHQQGRAVYWRTDAQLAPIFLAAAAWLMLRGRKVPAWTSPAAVLVALTAAAGPDVVANSVGTVFLALAIATLDGAPTGLLRSLSLTPFTALGVWSYSIYLLQQPFYRLAFEGRLGTWAALPLAVGAGLASFYFIEQPARRWLNANWRTGQGARAAAAASPAR